MRRSSLLLATLLIFSMLLAACGGEQTSTTVPSTNVPPITAESTMTEDSSAMTGTPEGTAGAGTTTPSVPVTGEDSPSRLTNLMDFTVWNQNGEQIGEVDDMVLDMDNSNISYVVIGTGGFLDLGEKTLLIPWDMLTLQADATGGQQNAFILDADQEMLNNAPDVDLETTMPGTGQPAQDWDTDIRNFWESGGTTTGTGTQAAATASPDAGAVTAVPDTTATTTTGTGSGTATDTGTATATTGTGAGTGTGTGTGQSEQLQGVMLASDLIGATLTIGQGEGQGLGTGAGTGTGTTQATAAVTASPDAGSVVPQTPNAGTGTDTAGSETGTGTATANQGPTSATVEDAIVDPDTGDILFLVLNSLFDDGERWIPIPLSTLRWDMTNESFLFVANANALQNAPFFQADQFPDPTTEDWDTDFNDFWENNAGTGGGTGTGSGTNATATP